ncbi:hypothetical protein BBI11_09070 [Planococcus maritimus]|uniref:hypothetical protein n=1 Tax=Planococcus maritimus TaxID=192421 RepID=UPI00080F1526|nr:hypothetical protein [Planococcus maritimus]ANU17158.1 hypothetical protein BBI11_09070 [Planococcus maritimus]
MKSLALGTLIFVFVVAYFWMQNNIDLAMNITGIVGIGGVLIGGFLKTGFFSSSAPVLGNLAIINLDKTMNLSNRMLLIALPNAIGSLLLYLIK